jgi:hypothetical protein
MLDKTAWATSMTRYRRMRLNVPDWGRVTLAQGRAFLSECLAVLPTRIDYLEGVTEMSWLYSRKDLDSSRGAVRRFCAWVDDLPTFRVVGRRPLGSIDVLNPKAINAIRTAEQAVELEWQQTAIGISVQYDMAFVIGEFMRVRYPWLRWEVDDDKRSISFAMPCIGGGSRDTYERMNVLQVSATMLLRSKEDGTGLYAEWMRCLPLWIEAMRQVPKSRGRRIHK